MRKSYLSREAQAEYDATDPEEEDDEPTLEGSDSLLPGSKLLFPKVPNELFRNPRFSPEAKLLYTLLIGYVGVNKSCYPGQERLCYQMGVSGNTLRAAMGQLIESGLVTVKRRGLGRTNKYYVYDFYIQKNHIQNEKYIDTIGFNDQESRTSKSEYQGTSASMTTDRASESDTYVTSESEHTDHRGLSAKKIQGEEEPDEEDSGDYILHTRIVRTQRATDIPPTLKDNGSVSDYDNESVALQTFAMPVPEEETPESPNPVTRTQSNPVHSTSSNPKSETFPQAGGLSVRPAATGKTYENFKPKLSPPLKGATQTQRLFALPLPEVKNEKSREAMLADLTEGGLVEPGRNPLRYYLQSFARTFNRVPEVGAYATAAVRLKDLVTRQGAEEYAQRLGRFFLDPNQQSRGYTYTNFLVCFDSYAFDKANIEVKSAGTRAHETTMSEIRKTLDRYADAGIIERG